MNGMRAFSPETLALAERGYTVGVSVQMRESVVENNKERSETMDCKCLGRRLQLSAKERSEGHILPSEVQSKELPEGWIHFGRL